MAKKTKAESPQKLATRISRKDGQQCASQHFGAWCIEPRWFANAVNAIRAGTWKPKAYDGDEFDDDDSIDEEPGYSIKDGIAVICIDGQMTKKGSSFGGCSTLDVRCALRAAAKDWMVRAIVLHICSPGGTVAGTSDLAADVQAVRSGEFADAKPVFAYIADCGCSAAYWVASQCETITANTTAMVGSIGTYCILEDDTAMQEQIGIKWRVVSTGEYKGLGADGTVSDKLVADVQREVNELNGPFLSAVAAGRGDKIPDMTKVADGRAYVSAQAQQLGLIDEIASLDAAIEAILQRSDIMTPTEQVKQIAAEHPEAVQSFIDEGKKVGATAGQDAERQRAKAIVDACGENHSLAIDGILAGHDPKAVSVTADHVAKAKAASAEEAKKSAAAIAAANARAEEAERKLSAAANAGHPGIPGTTQTVAAETAAAAGTAPAADANDPETVAKADWAKLPAETKAEWLDEKTYVGYRKAELAGRVRTNKIGA